jgi:hypothetical protein
MISPTGGRTVLFMYSNWLTGNCMTSLLGPCSSCRSSHFMCLTQLTLNLNLLTSAITALRSTIQGIIIPSMSFILHMQQKAIPPATQSCLPPPPWPSRSQVAAACLRPPPQPSCRLPALTTTAVMTQATLTPPGLTTGKVTGCGPIVISANPATTQATLTPPGLDPWQSNGSVKESEGRESGVCSSSSVYYLEMDDGQSSQGSGGSGTSQQGETVQGISTGASAFVRQ